MHILVKNIKEHGCLAWGFLFLAGVATIPIVGRTVLPSIGFSFEKLVLYSSLC